MKTKLEFDDILWCFDSPDGTTRIAVLDNEMGEFRCEGCGGVIPVECVYARVPFDEMIELV